MPNGITPIKPNEKKWSKLTDTNEKINLIYHTTPHRGLEILNWWLTERLPLLPTEIKERIHVNVFSSFKIYGWEQRDEPYKELFEQLEANPQVTYHGSVSNDVVREYLAESHIFAYPCIWPETFCIAGVEALSSLTPMVTSNLAALPEITGGFEVLYPFSRDINVLCSLFAYQLESFLKMIVVDPERIERDALFQKSRVDCIYNWDNIKHHWTSLIHSVYQEAIDNEKNNDRKISAP